MTDALLERYLEGRTDLEDFEKEQVRRILRVPEHMLARDCQCDPDVWGPTGLERGTGHNPVCPNYRP